MGRHPRPICDELAARPGSEMSVHSRRDAEQAPWVSVLFAEGVAIDVGKLQPVNPTCGGRITNRWKTRSRQALPATDGSASLAWTAAWSASSGEPNPCAMKSP